MFTGIVEGKGEVKSITAGSKGFVISVEAPFDLSADSIGDSIAINGICLTITTISGNTFRADVSKETLSRTTLSDVKKGEDVNLERALKVGDRMGGHIVTGHIDGTGKIGKRETRGESVWFEVTAPDELMRYMVEKGSVTLDGISLTINSVGKDFFALNIIPHTLDATTLGSKKPRDTVNIETDIIGKYVERLMQGQKTPEGVGMELLKECGFA